MHASPIKGAVIHMLVKPLVNNDCFACRLIIILTDSTPTKEETHHEVEFIREEFSKCFHRCVTSSLSVLSSFWAAAAAALGTWLTLGLEAMRTGVLGMISWGIRPGDTGLR